MRPLERRRVAASLGLALGLLAGAVQAGQVMVPVAKVFPFLGEYLSLPPSARDRFAPSYALHAKAGRLEGTQAWLVLEDRRTPLAIGPNGMITPPLRLADVRGGRIAFSSPPGTRIGVRIDVVASLSPRSDLPTALLEASLVQANKAMHTDVPLVGPPRLRRLVFQGAEGGELVLGSGQRSPLPVDNGVPYYEPSVSAPGAVIHFRRAPSRVVLSADHP